MARQSEATKELRSAISLLQGKGIIPSNFRAGSVTATKGGTPKWVLETVAKFDDVVSGKAEPIPESKLRSNRKNKYELIQVVSPYRNKPAKRFRLVDKTADETVVIKKGLPERLHIQGIKTIVPPFKFENKKQFFSDLRKFNPTSKEYPSVGFRYRGGSSHVYGNMNLLVDDLEGSNRRRDDDSSEDFYENMELVLIADWHEWNRLKKENREKALKANKLQRTIRKTGVKKRSKKKVVKKKTRSKIRTRKV